MYEYYKKYQVEDAKREINNRYPAVLENDIVFNEVIGIADATFYNMVNKVLWQGPESAYVTVEDVLQNAAIRLFELRLKRFEDRKFNDEESFFKYVAGVYKIVAFEERTKRYDLIRKAQEIHKEEYEEKGNDNDKTRNDFEIIDATNELSHIYEPEKLIQEIIENEERNRMGQIVFDALSQTKIVPHKVIAYCYSVFMPRVLQIFLNNNGEMEAIVQKILDELWEEYRERESGKSYREEELYYGKSFMQKFNPLIKDLEWDIPIQVFCVSAVINPVITNNIECASKDESEEKKYYRRILKEITKVCRHDCDSEANEQKSVKIDRKSEVLVEVAKVLMDSASVGKMSGDFQNVLNTIRLFSYDFQWGKEYVSNLDKGYTDARHGINIEREYDLIFSEFFSKPSGDDEKENIDYLGRNIRNFSVRFKEKLLVDVLNLANQCVIIANSDEAMERLKKACGNNTKSK